MAAAPLVFLSEADVAASLDMPGAVEVNADAFRALSSGDGEAPDRLVLPVDPSRGEFSLCKPATLRGAGVLGTKLVGVRPGNAALGLPTVPSLVVLQDLRTGLPTAVMGGTHLTALRTAAGSGVATRLLAPPDAAEAVVFGAGLQGHQHALAVCAVRPSVRRVTLVNRSRPRAEALAERLRGELGGGVELRVALLADAEAVRGALAGAAVVCCTTDSDEPLFPAAWLPPHACHLNLVGSYRPHSREVDAATVDRAALLVADTTDALQSCGELVPVPAARVRLLGDLLLAADGGGAPRPQGAAPLTIFKSVGTAVQDAATAAAVLRRAVADGRGVSLSL